MTALSQAANAARGKLRPLPRAANASGGTPAELAHHVTKFTADVQGSRSRKKDLKFPALIFGPGSIRIKTATSTSSALILGSSYEQLHRDKIAKTATAMSFSFPKPRPKKSVLPPAPSKKRKAVHAIEEIAFDDGARSEYLSGFHKRKVQRQKHAQKEAAERARQERIVMRKEVCDATF